VNVIFKLVFTDLHLLFRYLRISKFLARASTGITNRIFETMRCLHPSTRESPASSPHHRRYKNISHTSHNIKGLHEVVYAQGRVGYERSG
jgi:hypothetical protein